MRTLSVIKELRHAVIDTIKAAKIEGLGDNVYEARTEDTWPEESSLAIVYTPSFKFDDNRTSPKTYKVSGSVFVDIICQQITENINDTLDEITAKVALSLQPLMPKVGFFGGITKRFVLASIDNNLSSLGEMNRGTQRIEFNTEFNVTLPLGGAEDDYLLSNTKLSIGTDLQNTQNFPTNMRAK